MDIKEIGRLIYKESRLTGSFRLRSGKTAEEYFDKYLFESKPALLSEISGYIATLVPEETEILAGLELGGVPIATAVSLRTGITASFIRKKAKDYGTMKISEGADVSGKQVCIIEDVTTTGGQIIKSALEIRKLGGIVGNAICVIIRNDNVIHNLKKEGIKLSYMFHMNDLI